MLRDGVPSALSPPCYYPGWCSLISVHACSSSDWPEGVQAWEAMVATQQPPLLGALRFTPLAAAAVAGHWATAQVHTLAGTSTLSGTWLLFWSDQVYSFAMPLILRLPDGLPVSHALAIQCQHSDLCAYSSSQLLFCCIPAGRAGLLLANAVLPAALSPMERTEDLAVSTSPPFLIPILPWYLRGCIPFAATGSMLASCRRGRLGSSSGTDPDQCTKRGLFWRRRWRPQVTCAPQPQRPVGAVTGLLSRGPNALSNTLHAWLQWGINTMCIIEVRQTYRHVIMPAAGAMAGGPPATACRSPLPPAPASRRARSALWPSSSAPRSPPSSPLVEAGGTTTLRTVMSRLPG